MERPAFSLPFSPHTPLHDIRRWIWLAVATLALSGLGPIILLAGRASSFAEKAFIRQSFAEALVIHVNLSAVAWFLAIALLFWALFTQPRQPLIPFLRGGTLGSFAAGVLLIALAPLLGNGVALFSNYIPMYTSPLFLLGLGLMAAALVMGCLDVMTSQRHAPSPLPDTSPLPAPLPNTLQVQYFGILGSVFIVVIALVHFAWAYARIEAPQAPVSSGSAHDYYELLYWAGGHVLQLAYTQLLMVAWLWLACAAGVTIRLGKNLLLLIFAIYPLVALASPLGFMGVSVPYDLYFYTQQMRHGGGLGTLALGAYLLWALARHGLPNRQQHMAWVFLVSSMAVFLVGGALGHMISGVNTIIPAHYHGSIVGTTLAFMGVIFLLLPRLGYADLSTWRSAWIQPVLYGGGSVLHAIGFAIAGGHGAERKTVVTGEEASQSLDAALQLTRLGGLLAIIGGGMFVVLAVMSYRRRKKTPPQNHRQEQP